LRPVDSNLGGTPTAARNGGAIIVWAPLIAGGALASYDPKFAIGAGGITLLSAGLGKKSAGWWIVGVLVLIIGLVFQWALSDGKDNNSPTPTPAR